MEFRRVLFRCRRSCLHRRRRNADVGPARAFRGPPQIQMQRAGEPTSLFACRPWVGLRSGDAGDGRVEPRRIESRGACQHRLVRQAIGSPRPWNAQNKSARSEEHTYELHSLMSISYAVFGLTQKTATKVYSITNLAYLHSTE